MNVWGRSQFGYGMGEYNGSNPPHSHHKKAIKKAINLIKKQL